MVGSYYDFHEVIDQENFEFNFDLSIDKKSLTLEVSSKNLKELFTKIKSRSLFKENDLYRYSKPLSLMFLELLIPLLSSVRYRKNRLFIKEFYQFFFEHFPNKTEQEKGAWILEYLRKKHQRSLSPPKKVLKPASCNT